MLLRTKNKFLYKISKDLKLLIVTVIKIYHASYKHTSTKGIYLGLGIKSYKA